MKTLIQNGTVLQNGQLKKLDVLFDEEQILKTEENIQDDQAEVIDASGLTVLPGLVDTHVHLRDPGYEAKETIATGTRAAAHGGFTTVFAMPNLKPFPSTVPAMEAYLKKIENDAVVRVFPFGTITDNEQGKVPTDYKALKQLGVRWFSDDGVGVARDEVMEQAMNEAVQADVMFSCHTEDMDYRRPGASVHDSPEITAKGWLGIPSACEYAQLERDLELVKKTGVKYHADHISAAESVQALAKAKAEGLDVTGEVTVHHLLLEDKDVQGPNWKMNPPLRSHEDRTALIEGLESGALDFIANDHAPHTEEEKRRPMDKAPFGIVSLETAFPLLYTEFVWRTKRWTLAQLTEWMSEKPARRFGLEKTGKIEPGYRPDLFLADLNAVDVIDKNKFESKGRNTPFDGWETRCVIKQTFSGGKTAWKEER
ncbi:MAG: dihydroorotase [Erysipelotrichaceae bacterium]|nr:dihydroorotase [Erysipelotrichaceae bacterium]